MISVLGHALPTTAGLLEITLILYKNPKLVLAGIVAKINPALKGIVPIFMGVVNCPNAFDNCAVKTFPTGKFPDVVNGTITFPPAQVDNCKMVSVVIVFCAESDKLKTKPMNKHVIFFIISSCISKKTAPKKSPELPVNKSNVQKETEIRKGKNCAVVFQFSYSHFFFVEWQQSIFISGFPFFTPELFFNTISTFGLMNGIPKFIPRRMMRKPTNVSIYGTAAFNFMRKAPVIFPAAKPTAIMEGKVPKPKAIIANELELCVPVSKAFIKATKTIPQGKSPLSIPKTGNLNGNLLLRTVPIPLLTNPFTFKEGSLAENVLPNHFRQA